MQELGGTDLGRERALDALALSLFLRYFVLAAIVMFLSNTLVASIVAFVVSLFSGDGLVLRFDLSLHVTVTSVVQFIVGLILSAFLFRVVLASQLGRSVGGFALSFARYPTSTTHEQRAPSEFSGAKE